MKNDIPIYELTYKLLLWLFPLINKFPKTQRFVLGQQIQNTALNILTEILFANTEKDKLPKLKLISTKLDALRILIRLAKDLKFISIKQYEYAATQINEIGKMLGGWIRFYQQGESS